MDLRMETSQAVSMLQPFRHPKPGLTIMDKVEELEEKLLRLGLIINYYCKNASSRFLFNHWADREKKLRINFINEYAQQVSKEAAVQFALYRKRTDEISTIAGIYQDFDDWYPNHQNQQ